MQRLTELINKLFEEKKLKKNDFFNDIYIREAAIKELQSFCVPKEFFDNPLFIRGMREQKNWADKVQARVLMAFQNSKPLGQLLFVNNRYTQCTEIKCIYVSDLSLRRKKIGTRLFDRLIEGLRKPGSFSTGLQAAIVANVFDTLEEHQQRDFFLKLGFMPLLENLDLLYLPMRTISKVEFQNIFSFYGRSLTTSKRTTEKERALIQYEPCCPWSCHFSAETEKALKQIEPSLQITKHICHQKKSGVPAAPGCQGVFVNGKKVNSFILFREQFQKEVNELLSGSWKEGEP